MAFLASSASVAALMPFNRLFSVGKGKRWNRLCTGYSARLRAGPSALSRFRASSFSSAAAGNAGGAPPLPEISEANKSPPPIYAWPNKKKPRVCILGGGFGGLYTALRLESLLWPEDKKPQVLLVDQSERFVFKPMLYELISGEVDAWEIAPRFSELLENTGVQFLQDKVKLLHPSDHWGMNGHKQSSCGGTVLLESGLLIEYDWLVLALGAETKLDVVPGALEFAIPFSTLEDACKVDNKLKTLERLKFGKDSLIRVAVVGCGYSGVELAATISERLQDRGIVQAINVETTICPTAPVGNREAALKVLSSRKVQLLLGYFVRCIRRVCDMEASGDATVKREGKDIAESNSEKYVLELQPAEKGLESQILEADLVLWTVGSKALLPELEPSDKPHELPLNARGQAETDEMLRVKGHPRIFALGDSSSLRDSTGRLLPATAQVAFQQADFAGWNLWAAINNRPLLPFRFQNLGEMMTLGRNDAAISPSFIDGLTLEGPIGHAARKLAYLIRLPTDKHRLKVGLSWFAKSAIDSVASVQSTLTKVLSGS
ncbi:Alternative NAD(P)H-ubiquinone oxidoreductase C1 [Hibiscus syriacus]|uniref:demethylphylloquinone reductase n=1 Tax=Hibiscus syriacus TaxID=106335 RepID=A0A6A2ZB52_HIBSY|nr:alternative NAD(P)H-ubiquinone oxidoreductase C1, chloroplastic/mitochondrial isoform X2 [Hibiscus syriacus]KAE8689204.1 Alternative NAD(P)H-ubiquinone oxidoreductase C1 [Hibiscus syriacus]